MHPNFFLIIIKPTALCAFGKGKTLGRCPKPCSLEKGKTSLREVCELFVSRSVIVSLCFFLYPGFYLLVRTLSCPHPILKDRKAFVITERTGGKKGKEKRDRAPRYDEKFKEGVIRLITERGRPSKEVAAELGICLDTLRNGLKAAGAPSPGQAGRQNREAKKDKNRGLRVF